MARKSLSGHRFSARPLAGTAVHPGGFCLSGGAMFISAQSEWAVKACMFSKDASWELENLVSKLPYEWEHHNRVTPRQWTTQVWEQSHLQTTGWSIQRPAIPSWENCRHAITTCENKACSKLREPWGISPSAVRRELYHKLPCKRTDSEAISGCIRKIAKHVWLKRPDTHQGWLDGLFIRTHQRSPPS